MSNRLEKGAASNTGKQASPCQTRPVPPYFELPRPLPSPDLCWLMTNLHSLSFYYPVLPCGWQSQFHPQPSASEYLALDNSPSNPLPCTFRCSSIAGIIYSKQHQSGIDHLKIYPKLHVLKSKEFVTAKLSKIQLNWRIFLKGNSQLWLSSLDELERLFKFF